MNDLEEPTGGTGRLRKLRGERASLLRRLQAAGIEPEPPVEDFDPAGGMAGARKHEIGRALQAWREQLRRFAASPPGDGDEPEPEPAKPPTTPTSSGTSPTPPVSTDPGEGGRAPAPPAGVDEREEMRKALRSFRKDALLARTIAEARALDPGRLIDALESLAEIDEDGALSLLDPVSGKRLPLDAATLRRLMPGAVAPPPGVAGGSGGKQPEESVPGAARKDIVERAKRSQRFYDAHKPEIEAELRRREREGQ